MPLSFPPNPTLGQQYPAPNGTVYTWDGFKWVAASSSSSSGGGVSNIVVLDESSVITTSTTSFNFVGSTVSATNSGSAVTVTVDAFALTTATTATLGVIQVGPTLTIDNSGVLNAIIGNLANWTESYQYHNWTDGSSIFTPVSIKDNVDAIIAVKGTGAHAGMADNNLRGTYATDWQKQNGSADQIASGPYSVISGGSFNKASGLHSVIVGGNKNLADADYSTIVGGQGGSSNGIIGAVVFPGFASGGTYTTPGVMQSAIYNIGGETTTATPQRLSTNGSSSHSAANQIKSQDRSVMHFRGTVIAKEDVPTHAKIWSWTFSGLLRQDIGSTTTDFVPAGIAPILTAVSNTSSGASLRLDLDNVTGCMIIEATGSASNTIRWSGRIETVEITDNN